MRDVKYKKLGYTIIKTTDTKVKSKKFVVFKDGEFKKHHTHVSSIDIGKTMINIVANNIIPKSNNKEFIESLIRLSSSKDYIKKLENKLKKN
ncbi:MAG: hypothetical protein ACRCX8_05185 [Sarcina sp.]